MAKHAKTRKQFHGVPEVSRPIRRMKKDPAAQVELEKEQVNILKSYGQSQAECWTIGKSYNRIVDEKLAERSGFRTARHYFAAKLAVIRQSTLGAYGRVARAFSQNIAVRYGMSKLYLLLIWCKLRRVDAIEADPGSMVIEVPREDGTTRPKPFAQVSAEELRQAIKHSRGTGTTPDFPELDRRILEGIAREIESHRRDDFQVRFKAYAHNGKAHFSLENVCLLHVDLVVDMIATVVFNERENAGQPETSEATEADRQPRRRATTSTRSCRTRSPLAT